MTLTTFERLVPWSGGAAEDDAAPHSVSYLSDFGWAGIGIGLATAFVATGWGGRHSSVLPFWLVGAWFVVAKSHQRAAEPSQRALAGS